MHHDLLKQYASILPLNLQDLFALKASDLGKKFLNLQIDDLLTQYALGIDAHYLKKRHVPDVIIPLVQQALQQYLKSVFLYRQYGRLFTSLDEVSRTQSAHKQEEILLQFAKQLLELYIEDSSPATEVFQYQTQKTVRREQHALIKGLTQKNANVVRQAMMGEGKTKVGLSHLAFLNADGEHLSVIEVPYALLKTNAQDLRKILKEVYDQDLILFEFDRHSPNDVISLKRDLVTLKDAIAQRKCLIMASTALQSLHLKWRELHYQAQFYPPNAEKLTELYAQIDLLKEILLLFKERAIVVIDELHKVLDINVELNYSIGEKVNIDPLVITASLDLYDFVEATVIQAKEDSVLSKLNGLSLIDFLNAPEILNHPEELLVELMAYYADRYLAINPNLTSAEKDRVQALLRAEFQVFLPLTLKNKLNEQYGSASTEKTFVAIPYAGNNTPTKNYFANYLESLNYTIQMIRVEGVPFSVFKTMIASWKKTDQIFYLQDDIKSLSEAQRRYEQCLALMTTASDFNLPLQLKEIDLGNEQQLIQVYQYFQKNKPFIRYSLEDEILPSITLYPHKLTSNAINHGNQVKILQGFSGTMGSFPTFHDRIDFDVTTSFGTRNFIKTLLINKNIAFAVKGKEHLEGCYALIDRGAHRRGQTNQQVAEELAKKFTNPEIDYVLFFKEDSLCAWKVGGTAEDIIKLPSTEPDVIERILKIKPHQRFTYYDQNHTTGIDIIQTPKARALMTVDVTTTMEDFLQAVMRMRQLSAEQTVEIVMTEALQAKLGAEPTLERLYTCLEEFEREKLAADVFKAACKKLYDVVQHDLDQRMLHCHAEESVELFKKYQSLLVDTNQDVLLVAYGERNTHEILSEIKETVLKRWQEVTASSEIKQELAVQCDTIIEDALTYCHPTQTTTLDLGTEVSIEQHQETQLQLELKTEVQMEIVDETLSAKPVRLEWAKTCALNESGMLLGSIEDVNTLNDLWRQHPFYAKKYPGIQWSNYLSLSTQFYTSHDRQSLAFLDSYFPAKPVLSTLFWSDGTTVHALVVSQEEASVFAQRISQHAQNDALFQSKYTFWLETANGLTIAGNRPKSIEKEPQYRALKEQVYLLDGDASLLASKKSFEWFSARHFSFLKKQMQLQKKMEDATLLKDLEKRIGYQLEEELIPVEEASDAERYYFKRDLGNVFYRLFGDKTFNFDALSLENQTYLLENIPAERLTGYIQSTSKDDEQKIEFLKLLPHDIRYPTIRYLFQKPGTQHKKNYFLLLEEAAQLEILQLLSNKIWEQEECLRMLAPEHARQLFLQLDDDSQAELVKNYPERAADLSDQSLIKFYQSVVKYDKSRFIEKLNVKQQKVILSSLTLTEIKNIFYTDDRKLAVMPFVAHDELRLEIFLNCFDHLQSLEEINTYADAFEEPGYFYQAMTTPKYRNSGQTFIAKVVLSHQDKLFKSILNALHPQYYLDLALSKLDYNQNLLDSIQEQPSLLQLLAEKIPFIRQWSAITTTILALNLAVTSSNEGAIKNNYNRLEGYLTDDRLTDTEKHEQIIQCLSQHTKLRSLLNITGNDRDSIEAFIEQMKGQATGSSHSMH